MISFGSPSPGLHGILYVWDVGSWEVEMRIETRRSRCWQVALTRDGKYLYSAAKGALRKWGVVTTDVVASATVAKSVVIHAIAVTPNGESVYTAAGHTAKDCEIRCWTSDLQLRGAIMGTALDEGGVSCLAVSPDGQTLASGATDKSIRLWDVNSHEQKAVLRGHTKPVSSVDFSPDGNVLVSGSWDSRVKTWDVSSVC